MVTLIDYNAGNLTSLRIALEAIEENSIITSNPDVIRRAERIIFPGVGAARSAMDFLRCSGLDEAIREVVRAGVPFLGICLGTQILLDHSEEDKGTEMLGLIPGRVHKFRPDETSIKVPHIGWNNMDIVRPHPMFENLAEEEDFYFVHSYYPMPKQAGHWVGTTEYAGVRFASALGRDNLIATQFHPEKSGAAGLRLIENFIKWNP